MSQSNPAVTYHGGATVAPHYSCREVVNIPISFPTAASMLKLDAGEEMKTDFQIEFDFKTVRSDALLLYLGLKDADDVLDFNFGYIEVVLLHIHHHCHNHHHYHYHFSHHHHTTIIISSSSSSSATVQIIEYVQNLSYFKELIL